MTTLTETAEVHAKCVDLIDMLKDKQDVVYKARKNDDCLKFSMAWDGLYPDTSMVDLTMHSFEWKLFLEKSKAELVEILVADCVRALQMRREMEAQFTTGSKLQ